MATRIAGAFVTGTDAPRGVPMFVAFGFALLFLAGLAPSRDLSRQSAWGIVTCALWTLVPLLAMYLISLSRPAYNPKFLLLATPGFLILVGRGISILFPGLFIAERMPRSGNVPSGARPVTQRLATAARMVVVGLFVTAIVLTLQGLYSDPALQRDDYRRVVGYINDSAKPQDIVLVNAPGQIDVVRYYYRGAAELRTLPIGRPVDVTATRAVLNELVAKERDLYAILWATEQADPSDVVGHFLAEEAFPAGETWRGNIRLAHYAVRKFGQEPQAQAPAVRFGDEILLERFTFSDPPRPIDRLLPVRLEWRPFKLPPSTRYKLFLHLLDSKGRLVAQRDTEPFNGLRPTSTWTQDEMIIDREAVLIPPGTPAGDYRLVLGLYSGETGQRLPVDSGGDSVFLGEVKIGRGETSAGEIAPDLSQPLQADLGEVRLLGYTLERSEFAPGEFVPLDLYWQARSKPTGDPNIALLLVNPAGTVVSTARAFDVYPATRLELNEIVRDVQILPLPTDAESGEYRILVSDPSQSYEIARVQVK
jgi:hypothetical protein